MVCLVNNDTTNKHTCYHIMSRTAKKSRKSNRISKTAVISVIIHLSQNKVANDLFKNEPQVVLYRSHGWTNDDERSKMAFYARNGIPLADIAKRFSVTSATVYNYKKDTRY